METSMDRKTFLGGSLVAAAGLASAATLTCGQAHADEAAPAADAGRVPGYCGPGDWLGEAPEIDESQVESAGDFDVVILGGGHSGLAAAFSAIDEGMSVAVVEKQPYTAFVPDDGSDGSGWYGCYIGHINSQFLIDKGFGPYNTGEFVSEFTKRAAGRCMPDVIKLYAQNGGAMFDRYHEIYDMYEDERKANDSNVYLTGVNTRHDGEADPDEGYFDLSDMFAEPMCNTQTCHFDDVEYPIEASGYKTWPGNVMFWGYHGNDIEFVHKYIVKYVQDNGGQWDFETTGIKLVTDEAGAVRGLIAQDAEGNYKQYNAKKGVIIAAGDYVGNPQMCWALLNEGMEWAERSGATAEDWTSEGSRSGDGMKMACWLGAMIEPSPRGWAAIGGGASGPWGTVPLLQLDEAGERMYNEAAIPQLWATNLRLVSPCHAWVSDANWKEVVGRSPLDHGAPDFGYDDYWNQLEKEMDALVPSDEATFVTGAMVGERKTMGGQVFCAETLEDLAGLLGYEGDAKQTFLDSIARYNELCASEDGDTDYGKDKKYMVPIDTPPFYGGTARGGHSANPMMVTMNGLITDKNLNVLKSDWTPIEGLYAVGNSLGNRFGMGYSTPVAGCSIGMAMTHGYMASKIIAAR